MSQAETIAVKCVDLHKSFILDGITNRVLRGINLEIRQGEFVVLMGKSGSGKTTLLNLIAGLDQPSSGKISLWGNSFHEFSWTKKAQLRARKIAYITQTHAFFSSVSVLDNIRISLLQQGLSKSDLRIRSMEALAMVGLSERKKAFPEELSGGEQQRVMAARALAKRPNLILADEPTGNLDAETGEDIIRQLAVLNSEEGMTIIAASHDLAFLRHGARLEFLTKGKLIPEMPEHWQILLNT